MSDRYPRVAASTIREGDTVDVFAHPAGMFGATPPGGGGYGSTVIGTVVAITPMSLPFTTLPGLHLVMADGREFDTVEGAVARIRHRPKEN